MAFETADGFVFALAFGDLAGDVCGRGWVHSHVRDRDAVNGRVELTVAAAMKA
ncbi:MAG: hypothetical protein ACXVHL_28055 [Solirubrobacteraceae bacterium]